MNETRERILDTAEQLFAEQGYAATSLRAIVTAAGVNLAAVHYYFRSKEALVEAVFLRRAGPANEERIRLLDRCESTAGSGRLDLEEVIEAFVVPAFRTAYDPARGGPVFQRFVGRLYAEGEIFPRIVGAHFIPLLARFGTALVRAVPEIPPDELFWRAHFAMGAVAQALRGTKDWESIQGSRTDTGDTELILKRLVAFLSAAFRAPVPASVPADLAPAVLSQER